jgi:ribosomal protein L29
MQRVKAHELRSKDETTLVAELGKQRKALAELRVSKVSSQPQVKLSKIRVSFGFRSDCCSRLSPLRL